jgi:hypothetical protein
VEHWHAAGYLASGLVLMAFGMKDMVRLRAIAILSNLAFMTYGFALDLTPIWLLHCLLLPMNAWRLSQALKEGRDAINRSNPGRWVASVAGSKALQVQPRLA